MALTNYGAESTNFVINTVPFNEFGETDPPITVEDIEQRSTLKRGIGGTSVRLDNRTRPKRVTVNLQTGSAEVRQLLAMEKSGVDFTATLSITGSNEKALFYDGVMTNKPSYGRGGKTTVGDDQFVFEFADSEEL